MTTASVQKQYKRESKPRINSATITTLVNHSQGAHTQNQLSHHCNPKLIAPHFPCANQDIKNKRKYPSLESWERPLQQIHNLDLNRHRSRLFPLPAIRPQNPTEESYPRSNSFALLFGREPKDDWSVIKRPHKNVHV